MGFGTGTGASSIAASTDTTLNNPNDADILSFDGATSKWKNLPLPVPVSSVAGRTGVITLAKGDVGLANVDNTTDNAKPISTATQTALDAKLAITSAAAIDTTNPGLPLGVASPGTGSAGASASDHTHAMPKVLELADTDASSAPTAGQVLVWDNTASKWKPGTPAVATSPALWESINEGEITLPRIHSDTSDSYGSNPVSGEVRFSYFRAQKTGSRSIVRFQTGGSAAATSTLAKAGIYSVNTTTGALTLLASCANKTTFSGTYNGQSCTMTAATTLTAGNTYAIGILQVATTAASLTGQWFNGTFMGATPKLAQKLTGQTDLPASVTSGLSDTQFPIYCEVV